VFAELSRSLPELLKYYPSDSAVTTKRLATVLGLNPQTVAIANGSTELITWIDHLLVRDSLAVPIPTFGRWTAATCPRSRWCASSTEPATWTW
jgi:histidinol-phosphate/aromatic aminotransferase/cobyric acid decarboxylase-like protein